MKECEVTGGNYNDGGELCSRARDFLPLVRGNINIATSPFAFLN